MTPQKKGIRKVRGKTSPKLKEARLRIRQLLDEKSEHLDTIKHLEKGNADLNFLFSHEQREHNKVSDWYREELEKSSILTKEVSRLSNELEASRSDAAMLVRLLREAKDAFPS